MANKPHYELIVRNYGGQFAQTIDGEECVKLWYTVGNSLASVERIFEERGITNPSTGMKVTRDAIAKAAWKWILEHPYEAMEQYIKPLCKATGVAFQEDAFWENYVGHTYSYIGSKSRRKELWKKYGLEDIAREMGERREKRRARRKSFSG